ncbi:DEAD/DEAH box helicase family protein [Brevundimonas olei]|uniref:DEAD/DEAH box helicase family protein n=1 Tax=Brevundimonas olei TaxID=657642 RepID=A0ABZ2IDZ2_9CAUL
MTSLRTYQQNAVESVLDYWRTGGGNPLVDMATGLGKSVTIGSLTRDLLTTYPDMRALMLVHVKELVAQNAQALLRLWPQAPVGIYSAGLGRRDVSQRIIFASIQSVYRRAAELGPFDLVLIDEAHLVPSAGEGMYRALLDKLREMRPDLRVCGFTATPFRMDSGRLDAGDARLFDEIVYSYGIAKGIDDGWLSPLISKRGATEIDVSGVAKRGGEFVSGALEAAADNDAITQAAVSEIIEYGQTRRSWLVFCAGVKHAHHVRDEFWRQGVSCEVISGDTDAADRARFIDDFRAGRLRCLTNCNVLTTGFDAPATDLIALLRPTLSPGLYVQMMGRGTRLADSKTDCLVLDFTGTARRLGPVDTITVDRRPGKKGAPDAAKVTDLRAKECPTCKTLAALNARTCAVCGHEWSMDSIRHEAEADDVAILSRDLKNRPPEEIAVVTWAAKRHQKQGSPDSVRVSYSAGLMSYPEWVLFEHRGPGRFRAEKWWRAHGGAEPVPECVADALVRWAELTPPAFISIRKNGKWHDIVARRHSADQEQAA